MLTPAGNPPHHSSCSLTCCQATSTSRCGPRCSRRVQHGCWAPLGRAPACAERQHGAVQACPCGVRRSSPLFACIKSGPTCPPGCLPSPCPVLPARSTGSSPTCKRWWSKPCWRMRQQARRARRAAAAARPARARGLAPTALPPAAPAGWPPRPPPRHRCCRWSCPSSPSPGPRSRWTWGPPLPPSSSTCCSSLPSCSPPAPVRAPRRAGPCGRAGPLADSRCSRAATGAAPPAAAPISAAVTPPSPPRSAAVASIVQEKELLLREGMRIMGLRVGRRRALAWAHGSGLRMPAAVGRLPGVPLC